MTIKPGDRVHCDKWLAPRPDGWEVTSQDEFWPDSVGIHGAAFPGGWTNFQVPLAACTLVPRPFKVGDWVKVDGGERGPGLVFSTIDGYVHVGVRDRWTDGYPPDRVTPIDPPEAPNGA